MLNRFYQFMTIHIFHCAYTTRIMYVVLSYNDSRWDDAAHISIILSSCTFERRTHNIMGSVYEFAGITKKYSRM